MSDLPMVTDALQAAREARAAGAIPHQLDGSGLTSKADALRAIAALLSFPDYFGGNLDALHDCLTDLSWLPEGEHVLIWSGSQALADADPGGYQGIHAVMVDAVGRRNSSRPLSVLLAAS